MTLRQTHETDEFYMNRVATGRPEMLDPLVRRYANPLLTFTTRMLGNRSDGEDVFQEVCLAIWAKRLTYKRGCLFRPWLFQIARNACRSRMRRSMRSRLMFTGQGFDNQPEPDSNDPVDSLLSDESSAQVTRAVMKLPERQRAVVVMRIWCSMPYTEIAESYGLHVGSVRAHMHQALKALRPHLAPYVLGHVDNQGARS